MNKTGKHQLKAKTAARKKPLALRVGLFLLGVVLIFNGYTLAKYFMEENQKLPVAAKNFYFESDLLAVSTGAIPNYTLKSGVDDITFKLMNYPDELRTSEVNISYTDNLSKGGEIINTQDGTLAIGKTAVDVSFTDLTPDDYTVTAISTMPYQQTLTARFTVVGHDYGLHTTVSDSSGSPTLMVTVKTTDYSGNIAISWPAGVLPDNTDELLLNAGGTGHTVRVEAQSEYTFLFFKNDPAADYSKSISVTATN